MKIKCIIVEDEPLALERLADYVARFDALELCATFDDARDALAYLAGNSVDLVFLDINLGELSGLEMLATSLVKSQVILTTAYQEYALRAFELQVADYLLKPYTFERFAQAVDRARALIPKRAGAAPLRFIFVKTENRLEKVSLREIVLIEGMDDYRRLHTTAKRLMTLQTFAEFERLIPPAVLCRVHKSYMVALDKIDSIEKDRIRIRDFVVPISETYRKRFFELINHPLK